MALDDALLRNARDHGFPVLRFYQWDRPAVSIGYVQKASAAPPGFAFVRRPTGGGVVYHDHDFTYSVVLPAGHWLTGLDRTRSYDWINRSVREALQDVHIRASLADQNISHTVDRETMVCFRNPTKYDVLLGQQKVAGSAQRRTRDGILHQGSLHFGGPLPLGREVLSEAMRGAFGRVLGVAFTPFEPSPEFLQAAEDLSVGQYATSTWSQRR